MRLLQGQYGEKPLCEAFLGVNCPGKGEVAGG
ncbi:Uncharacterised protein [Serratia entomophila]|nr:Uncharacterised protein [Serratia entomophila]CAI0794328.1 Uncharacterised protein [Serratia entomophila]CAI0795195.1 Uncharacterised protein [Serratia entomophila]CAI0795511.1 Uncharacterised protein [Serratia entomophila]CAI1547685.1 Uncharacterised protein [Serratia entomophila]